MMLKLKEVSSFFFSASSFFTHNSQSSRSKQRSAFLNAIIVRNYHHNYYNNNNTRTQTNCVVNMKKCAQIGAYYYYYLNSVPNNKQYHIWKSSGTKFLQYNNNQNLKHQQFSRNFCLLASSSSVECRSSWIGSRRNDYYSSSLTLPAQAKGFFTRCYSIKTPETLTSKTLPGIGANTFDHTKSTRPEEDTGSDSENEDLDKLQKIEMHNGVDIIYFRGLPQITVPLPSRREKCRFILKPLTNSVGDLINMIRMEDKGIDHITILSKDGTRIASSNTIEMLMEQDFSLIINDIIYHVVTPPQEKPSKEDLERLSSVRNLVGQLYAALNVDEHQLRLEREMLAELEKLHIELTPLEEKRDQLSQISTKRTTILTWAGLGLMSVQFGILARLTWWEYSWDIMEPVTYFVTYGTAVLCYAYFVLTKQDYVLPEVRDRQYLLAFHKNAKKIGLDVEKYNELRNKISIIEANLKRLRDPLSLQLPPSKTRPFDINKLSSDYSTSNIISRAQQKIQQFLKKTQNSS